MKKAMDMLMKTIAVLIGMLLFIAVIMVFVQIIWRYALRSPLGWTDQLCRFLYVWIIMLGIPVLFHYKAVTVFDFFSGKLQQKQQTVLQVAICLLTIFFAVFFFIFSWAFMMKKGGQMIPAFRTVPYYFIYVSMPISALLLVIEMIFQLIENVGQLKGKGGEQKC